MKLFTIARPYSQAVFDFACKHKTLDKWQLMLTHAKNITKNKLIMKLLFNFHCIKPLELSEIFIDIGKHTFDIFGQNFIRIMAEYKKLYLLPVIFDQFIKLRYKYEKIILITIVTANLLTNKKIFQLISIFEKNLLYKVNIIQKLDPSIISGIVIYINNIVIDTSIQGRIARLKDHLKI